jgi:hypothetical protein
MSFENYIQKTTQEEQNAARPNIVLCARMKEGDNFCVLCKRNKELPDGPLQIFIQSPEGVFDHPGQAPVCSDCAYEINRDLASAVYAEAIKAENATMATTRWQEFGLPADFADRDEDTRSTLVTAALRKLEMVPAEKLLKLLRQMADDEQEAANDRVNNQTDERAWSAFADALRGLTELNQLAWKGFATAGQAMGQVELRITVSSDDAGSVSGPPRGQDINLPIFAVSIIDGYGQLGGHPNYFIKYGADVARPLCDAMTRQLLLLRIESLEAQLQAAAAQVTA